MHSIVSQLKQLPFDTANSCFVSANPAIVIAYTIVVKSEVTTVKGKAAFAAGIAGIAESKVVIGKPEHSSQTLKYALQK